MLCGQAERVSCGKPDEKVQIKRYEKNLKNGLPWYIMLNARDSARAIHTSQDS